MSNWMSDGRVAASARCGLKENGPTASSALSATASAPVFLRAVRRVMCAGESNEHFSFVFTSKN